MLGDMKFLDSLKEYDKDNIPSYIIKKIREKYITNKDFDPSIIKNISSACEGLCKWIRAIDIYDSVIKVSSFIFMDEKVLISLVTKNQTISDGILSFSRLYRELIRILNSFLCDFCCYYRVLAIHSTKFFMYAVCIENTCCHFKKKHYHSMIFSNDSNLYLCFFCYYISAGLFYTHTMYVALRLGKKIRLGFRCRFLANCYGWMQKKWLN